MSSFDALMLTRDVIVYALRGYYYLIIVALLMSWVRPDPAHPVVRFIRRLTDPPMNLARRFLPFLRAGIIDFSPIAVILLLELLAKLVVKLFDQLAVSFG